MQREAQMAQARREAERNLQVNGQPMDLNREQMEAYASMPEDARQRDVYKRQVLRLRSPDKGEKRRAARRLPEHANGIPGSGDPLTPGGVCKTLSPRGQRRSVPADGQCRGVKIPVSYTHLTTSCQ